MVVPTPTLRRWAVGITRRYVRPVRRALVLPTLVLTAVVPAPIAAAATPSAGGNASRLLWATINVCDTPRHPDTIGIRASMPGSGHKGERMYMRFQVQYFKTSANEWANGDATADSGFRYVGSAKYRRRESGWNFAITPPPAGQSYRLRGIVTFEWRKRDVVMRRERRRTRSGHTSTTGADPKGFSAAECIIKSEP
jgi:hypothetical protein